MAITSRKYNPEYAANQCVEAIDIVVGAAIQHWLGWWYVLGWVLGCFFKAIYHEVKYGS